MSGSLSIVWTSMPAELAPGEVVWATVMNPRENPGCTGKPRPAVLVTPLASGCLIMGLTSNSRHQNGTPARVLHDAADRHHGHPGAA